MKYMKPYKIDHINEMIDMFDKVQQALVTIRDTDKSEAEVLSELGINCSAFRRVVYDINWNDKTDGSAFKNKFDGVIPTRHWTENLFCAIIGIKNDASAITKYPSDVRITIIKLIKDLPEREQKTIVYTYRDEMKLDEIGELLGVSAERARQIQSRALRKLQNRGRQAYLVLGDGYWFEKRKIREKILEDNSVKLLEEEIKRLENLLSHRRTELYDTPSLPDEISIRDVGLSVRAYNCLHRASINTLSELIEHTPSEIKKLRNMGEHTLEEIETMLDRYGLVLKEETEA